MFNSALPKLLMLLPLLLLMVQVPVPQTPVTSNPVTTSSSALPETLTDFCALF